jgi:hypothetical protein
MGDIPVASDDDVAPARCKFDEMRIDQGHESEFRCLPLLGTGTRGLIKRDDREIPEISTQIAPFAVKFVASEFVE